MFVCSISDDSSLTSLAIRAAWKSATTFSMARISSGVEAWRPTWAGAAGAVCAGAMPAASREHPNSTTLANLCMRDFHGEPLAGLTRGVPPASLCQPWQIGNPSEGLIQAARASIEARPLAIALATASSPMATPSACTNSMSVMPMKPSAVRR